ncbi:MFS transporter [Aquabacterium sp. J223]|uniref:MFS transporter n=1 Tax=Aquabacterium sp. J223 TaxID=2898431 RepID=UPI0021AD9991|nr:MFS transporter [Aquabacterium sp. J223]UUX95745.1 MFS transporter [Aquabacterium sp. J223]
MTETARRSRDAMAPAEPGVISRDAFFALFTAVMLPMFMAAVDQTLLATATPRIARELGGLSGTAWIAVGYLLAATLMAPLYGRLGDRYGRRRLLQVALGLFALGSLACGLAPTLGALVAGRLLQGLGGGGLMVMSQALIGELVPPRDRPRFQGWFAIVFTASSVGGPVIGGVVVNHASWRWLFLVNLPLAAIALWRTQRLPAPPRDHAARRRMDPLGALLFALAAGAALLWFSMVGHGFALRSATSAGLAAAAVVGALLLAAQQRRHPAPFLPLDLVRLPGMAPVCVMVVAFAGTLFGLIFLLPIYLQLVQGRDAASSGLQLLPLTGGIVVGSLVNGRLTARWGVANRLPPFGLGAAGAAVLALALLPGGPALTTALVAVCGLGLGTVMPNAQITTQLLAGRRNLGTASALVSLVRSSGASLGTAAFSGLVFALLPAGALQGRALAAGLSGPAVAKAFHLAFAAVALLAFAGAWAATRVPTLALDHGRDAPETIAGEP